MATCWRGRSATYCRGRPMPTNCWCRRSCPLQSRRNQLWKLVGSQLHRHRHRSQAVLAARTEGQCGTARPPLRAGDVVDGDARNAPPPSGQRAVAAAYRCCFRRLCRLCSRECRAARVAGAAVGGGGVRVGARASALSAHPLLRVALPRSDEYLRDSTLCGATVKDEQRR